MSLRPSRRLAVAALASIVPILGIAPSGASPQAPSAVAIARYPHAVAAGTALRATVESDRGAVVGGVQIFVAAGLDRQPRNRAGLAALVADAIVRSPEPGAIVAPGGTAPSIREAIAESGGLLQYTVEGRSVHFYLEAPGEALPAMIARFGRVLAAPSLTPAIVNAARASLVARATDLEGSALSVGVAMFRRSYYTGGPGQPVFGSSASLAPLTTSDVAAFYRRNYVRQAVSASVVGDVADGIPDALDALAQALPSGTIAPIVTLVKPIPATPTRIVSRRDVGAPQVVVGFAAPSPASPDFGAMLVLEALLSDAFERTNATEISEPERSVGAAYLYDTTPASIVVYVNGGRVDPAIALRELVIVSRSLAKSPLQSAAFARFKTSAEGAFVTGSMTLADRSYLLGSLSSQGLGSDAINAALGSLDRTTSADVRRVAKKYLQRFIIALVLPRSDPANAGG